MRWRSPREGLERKQVSEWVSLRTLVNLKKEQKSSKVITCTHGQILKKPYENILVKNSE